MTRSASSGENKRPRYSDRHKFKLTFVGDEGKPFRIAAIALLSIIILAVIIVFARRDTNALNMPEVESVVSAGVLTVGVRDDVIGMAYNGVGLECELGLLLAERILPDVLNGDAVQYVTVNSKTVGPKLSDGSINVAVCMMQKDASALYAYSDVYYRDTVRFVIREGERVTATDIVVGCIQSTVEESRLTAYMASRPENNLSSISYAAYDDMLNALIKGKVDAVVMRDLYIEMYSGTYAITPTSLELGTVDYAFACPIDTPAIADVATLLLTELKESGELAALYTKYGCSEQAAYLSN